MSAIVAQTETPFGCAPLQRVRAAIVHWLGGHYNGFTPQERRRAYNWFRREIKEGRRELPTQCEACLQTEGKIEPHSEDYSGPPYGDHVGKHGLCYRCHIMLHCRFTSPGAFERYRDMVREGFQWPPLPGRDFGAVTALLRGDSTAWREAVQKNEPREATFLDELSMVDNRVRTKTR